MLPRYPDAVLMSRSTRRTPTAATDAIGKDAGLEVNQDGKDALFQPENRSVLMSLSFRPESCFLETQATRVQAAEHLSTPIESIP